MQQSSLFAAIALGFGLLLGCEPDSGSLHLIQVVDVSPRKIAEGERLELVGRAFPEGRPTRVTFKGELARPGQLEAEHIEINAAAQVTSPHSLFVELDSRLTREFCGKEAPEHASFHGVVEVAFSPRVPGAAPVTGESQEVLLDVIPVTALEQHEARAAEARRYADFMGVLLKDGARGLEVSGVMPKSPAEVAGLMVGDGIEQLDSVHVLSIEDFVPTASGSPSRALVHRTGLKDPALLTFDSEGFRPKSLTGLLPALALVAIPLLLALFLLSPLGRVLTLFERFVVSKLRERVKAYGKLELPFVHAASAELPRASTPYLGVVLVAGAFSALSLGKALVAEELDLFVLFAASFSALFVSTALGFGENHSGIASRAKATLALLVREVAVALALASGMVGARGFRAADLVLAQGALPWGFAAFSSPAALMGCVCLVLLLCGRVASLSARPRAVLLTTAEWAHLMTCCSLGAMVFLGGFRVPFASVPLAGTSLLPLGALLQLSKALALLMTVLWLRRLAKVSVVETLGVTLRALLPLAALGLVLGAAWVTWGRRSRFAVAGDAFALATLGAACLIALLLAMRIRQELRRPSSEPSISPWL